MQELKVIEIYKNIKKTPKNTQKTAKKREKH